MIAKQAEHEIIRSGKFTEQHFKLAQNAHIFKILRDGIYSDKVLAVIREYWANARDEHMKIGKPDLPVDITLPGYMSPYLKIRDYAKGMTKEQVADTYISYGTSTKTHSDDFIGALGIGSKSAFCYTTMFQVTSFIDGKATVYSCYIDETEMGKIALVSSTKSDEPSGVEISVPVNSSDFNLFNSKVRQLFRYAKSRPNIKGSRDFKFDTVNIAFQNKDWIILGDGAHHSYCSMGDVPYVFDMSAFKSNYESTIQSLRNAEKLRQEIEIEEKKRTTIDVGAVIKYPQHLPEVINTILQYEQVIYFNIGELEIAASREALSYKSKTIIAIYNKLTQICADLEKVIDAEILAAKTLWDAKLLFNRYFQGGGGGIVGSILHSVGRKSIVWNGATVNTDYITWKEKMVLLPKPAPKTVPLVNLEGKPYTPEEIVKLTAQEKAINDTMVMPDTINCIVYRRNAKHRMVKETTIRVCATCRKDRIIINDTGTPRGVFTGMNALLPREIYQQEYYYVFDCFDKNNFDILVNLFTELGVPFEYLSKIVIPKTQRTGYTQSPKYSKKFFTYTRDPDGGKNSDNWTVADIDPEEEEGVYVVIEQYLPQIGRDRTLATLDKIAKFIETIEKKPLVIYGVKPTVLPKITNNWVKLEKYVTDIGLKLLANANLEQRMADARHYQEHLNNKNLKLFIEICKQIRGQVPVTASIENLWKRLEILINNHTVYQTNAEMIEVMTILEKIPSATAAKPSVNIDDLTEKFYDEYPMLRYAGEYFRYTDIDRIFINDSSKYIMDIEKSKMNLVASS